MSRSKGAATLVIGLAVAACSGRPASVGVTAPVDGGSVEPGDDDAAARVMALLDAERRPREALLVALEAAGPLFARSVAPSPPLEHALSLALAADRRGAELRGHRDAITAVVNVADGSRALTTGADGTARLFDVRRGAQIVALEGHAGPIVGASVSRDGALALTVGSDRTARLWDTSSGRGLATLPHGAPAAAAALSPDGKLVATADDAGNVVLSSAPAGAKVASLAGPPSRVVALAFSPDGSKLVTAGADRRVRVWSVPDGKAQQMLEGDVGEVLSLAITPDGEKVITGSADRVARVFAATGKLLAKLEGHAGPIDAVQVFANSQQVLTASSDGTARLWDMPDGTMLAELVASPGRVSAAVSRDGAKVALVGLDGVVRVFDASGAPLHLFDAKAGPLSSVAFSADGARVIAAGADGVARAWLLDDPRQVARVAIAQSPSGGPKYALADGKLLEGYGDRLTLYDTTSGKPIGTARFEGQTVFPLALSRDGARALVSGKGERVINTADGKTLVTLAGLQGAGLRAVFSAHGERLAVIDAVGKLHLFRSADGGEHAVIDERPSVMALSDDGALLAIASKNHDVALFDAATGKPRATLSGHRDAVASIVFSADTKRVLSASADGSLRLWSTETGAAITAVHDDGPLEGASAPSPFTHASFAREQTTLFAVRADGLAQLLAPDASQIAWVEGAGRHAALSPDGSRVAGGLSTLRLWQLGDARPGVALGDVDRRLSVLRFAPDGRSLMAISWGEAVIWPATAEALFAMACAHLEHQPDAARVAAWCKPEVLAAARGARPGKPPSPAAAPSSRRAAAPRASASVAASASASPSAAIASSWPTCPGAPEPERPLAAVRFADRGDALTVLSNKGDEARFSLPDGALRFASVAKSKRPLQGAGRFDGDPPDVTSVAIGADGHAVLLRDPLAFGEPPGLFGRDATTEQMNRAFRRFRDAHPPSIVVPSQKIAKKLTRRGEEPVIFPGSECQDCSYGSLVLSPDGALSAVQFGLSNDVLLRLYDMATGHELEGPRRYGLSPVFAHRARRLAFAVDHTVVIEDISPPSVVGRVLAGNDGRPFALVFSPDDALVAGVADRGFVLDVMARKIRCQGPFADPIAFSPSGELIAARQGDSVVLVRSRDCEVSKVMAPSRDGESSVLAFSPDGALVAELVAKVGVTVYDVATGAVLLWLRMAEGGALAITPDGRAERLGRTDALSTCTLGGRTLASGLSLQTGLLGAVLTQRRGGRP